jgi:GLPGLI family protein
MNRKAIIVVVLLASSALAQAQQFITHGKIEFERKVNQHSFLEEGNMWDEMMKKNTAKFYTTYYDLYFKDGQLLYKNGRDPDVRQMKAFGVFEAENTVRTNLDSNTSIAQKDIRNDLFLVSDSLRKIDWKIGIEIRKIAGFDCRKAVGKILDSLVVIAFYTDEILPSGGPESFTGLPGMILGIAIPRLHTTWYATKLEVTDITDKDLITPKKGKKYSSTDFQTYAKDAMKEWGEDGKRMVPQLLL